MTRGQVLAAIAAGALSGAAMVVGCNQIVGINDPVNGSTNPVTPTGDGSDPGDGGGGTDTSSSTDLQARFVGTWNTTNAATSFMNCSAAFASTNGSLSQILTAGPTTDSIIISPNAVGATCHIRTTIQSDGFTLALADNAQRCDHVVTTSETDTYAYFNPSTFAVDPGGGSSAQARIQAKVTSAVAPGQVCDFLETSLYVKQQ